MEHSKFLKGRRLRMFAGPNGSGKSTILNRINTRYSIGQYINPDHIDLNLKTNGFIRFSDYGLRNGFDYKFNIQVKDHSIAKKARSENLPISLVADGDVIRQLGTTLHSYNSAFLSDFLRNELVAQGKKLSFETVMSHESKLEFLRHSASNGYKNYLYFVSTASPDINVERVKLRVKENGHDVEENRIRARYNRTMNLLNDAISLCYRSFVFDNSGKEAKLICEIDDKRNINIHTKTLPFWVFEIIIQEAINNGRAVSVVS
jgi:predicted ABC-type ATPase